MSTECTVKLKSSVDEVFQVDESVESKALKNLIQLAGTDGTLHLENVARKILTKGGVMSSDIMVKLQSSDGQMFEVEESVAQELKMLTSMTMDKDDTHRLANVTSEILEKVIKYARYHVEARNSSEEKPAVTENEIKKWDAEFVRVEYTMLADLIVAAKYLDYAALLDLTSQGVAHMIMGKTVEEIRKTFNIENDFTPEEEEEIRKENQWAFDFSEGGTASVPSAARPRRKFSRFERHGAWGRKAESSTASRPHQEKHLQAKVLTE